MAEHPLRILQVNSWDIGGGAANVAWNLFSAYQEYGHNSWLAVGRKYSSHPRVLQIQPNHEFYGRWSEFWWKFRQRLARDEEPNPVAATLRRMAFGLSEPELALNFLRGVENFNFPGSRHLLSLPNQMPDVMHGHNLHDGYFDLRVLPQLSRQVPLVLTLHDAWMLSGHCAHSFDCARWITGCGACPDLTIPPAIRRDATRHNWRKKREIYEECRLFVATPSHWLMRKVERSMLAPGVVEARVIPNGVDLDVFRPADRRAARAILGLPLDARILLFTANSIKGNVWKDAQTMRQAVAAAAEQLPGESILFLALGESAPPDQIGPEEIRYVPYQSAPDIVARYFQAADIYLHAARADTFPNTVLEALACGTPVVATAVGGIPEQIEDGRTGYLVPPANPSEMAGRIVHLLADDMRAQQLGAAAAEDARQRFNVRYQVDAYLTWYQELLDSRRRVPKEASYALTNAE